MTALRPVESWDVTPVEPDEERKLLRKVIVNPTCAHPDCDKPTESVHHLVPRGTVGSSSWFVRIPGVDRPVLHCVGLCGTGTTGHHGDLEEHRGWVRFEDGVWNWYDEPGVKMCACVGNCLLGPNYTCSGKPREELWKLLGPLDPQPGQISHRKARKRKQGGEKRARANVSIAVPKDSGEDGAGVLDDLIQTGRELWAPELGWSESVPAYYVVVAAFAKAFQS